MPGNPGVWEMVTLGGPDQFHCQVFASSLITIGAGVGVKVGVGVRVEVGVADGVEGVRVRVELGRTLGVVRCPVGVGVGVAVAPECRWTRTIGIRPGLDAASSPAGALSPGAVGSAFSESLQERITTAAASAAAVVRTRGGIRVRFRSSPITQTRGWASRSYRDWERSSEDPSFALPA